MRWRVVTFVGFFFHLRFELSDQKCKKKKEAELRKKRLWDCESVWGARWTFSLVHATAVTVTGVTWRRHGGVVLPLPFISAAVFKLVVVVVVDLQKPFKRDCTHTHKYKTQNKPPQKRSSSLTFDQRPCIWTGLLFTGRLWKIHCTCSNTNHPCGVCTAVHQPLFHVSQPQTEGHELLPRLPVTVRFKDLMQHHRDSLMPTFISVLLLVSANRSDGLMRKNVNINRLWEARGNQTHNLLHGKKAS